MEPLLSGVLTHMDAVHVLVVNDILTDFKRLAPVIEGFAQSGKSLLIAARGLEGAAKHDVTVTRRVSGGGAMFIQPGNTITYSLSVPSSLVEGLSFEQSYAFLDDWVLGALRDVGVEATYVPLNDIASPAGKIAGAAQKRYAAGAVLHHVTMAYNIDADAMLEVLRIGREKLSDKGTKSANKRVDPVRSQTGMSREDVIAAFLAHFAGRYATQAGEVTPDEVVAARTLVEEKFATDAWIGLVP